MDKKTVVDAMILRMTVEGATPEEIEAAVNEFGFSMGVEESKKKEAKKKSTGGTGNMVRTSKAPVELSEWVIAVNNTKENVMIVLEEHDIPYKEQFWNVPRREVIYGIKAIKNTAVVKGIVDRCKCEYDVVEDAYKGEKYRWLEVRTDEIVPTRIQSLGYVLLGINENGKVYCKNVFIKKTAMSKENIKVSQADKKIRKTVERFIKSATETAEAAMKVTRVG